MNDSIPFLIGLGLGLGLAAGIRPFLPALLAGALASGGLLGLTFAGSYAFLQEGWWLIACAAALLLAWLVQVRVGSERFEAGVGGAALAGLGIGAGALLFAGTLAGHGHLSWPGLAGGAAAALIAQATVRPLAARVRGRLPESERGAREAVTLYLDIAALLLAGLTALLHPLGYVALALIAWLALAGRRRGAGRYAGLRMLGR